LNYSKYKSKELILRDNLAIDRTNLANERTLLSYLRSSAALIIAGISIVNLSNSNWFTIIGIICVPIGILTGIFGIIRFTAMNKKISNVRENEE
jgi:putative membrane protein